MSLARHMNEFLLPPFPLPPSVNDAYADRPFFKNGYPGSIRNTGDLFKWVGCRRILSREAESYKQEVSNILNQTGTTTALREYVQEHLTVSVNMYVYRAKWLTIGGQPNKNAGDADNRVKILQDIIFKTIGIDDSHAFHTGVTKMYGTEEKVIVVFRKLPDEVDEF